MNTHGARKPAQIRSCARYPRSSRTAAWPRCEAPREVSPGRAAEASARAWRPTEVWVRKPGTGRIFGNLAAESKDPSGGTTGRVKLYGALGVDGRSRRIQPMGRDNRSHIYCVAAGLPNVQNVRRFSWVPVRGESPKITAQQGDWRHLRPIYPMPWTAGNHSTPGSQNCYRRLTDQAPAFFLRQLCWTQRQPEPPARRPRP